MPIEIDTVTPLPVPGWLTTQPIAHRGLHTLPHAPENSFAAFDAAIRAGYPIELDLHLLTAGQLAVFHDHDLKRLTGAEGDIRKRSAKDLADLRLLGTDERVPLFSEVLERVAGRVPLLIETKTGAEDAGPLEAATLQALAGYEGPFAIQSFSAPAVAYLAKAAPNVVRGQLASDDRWQDAAGVSPLPPHFIAYNISVLPTPLSSALRAKGIPLIAWTIRTGAEEQRANGLVDNIIFEHILPQC